MIKKVLNLAEKISDFQLTLPRLEIRISINVYGPISFNCKMQL